MKASRKQLWKKSMLQGLNLYDIRDWLYEIGENGDEYEYPGGDDGYYQEYKPMFDELSGGAFRLLEALDDYDVSENRDDMTVAVLEDIMRVLGYDVEEEDYFSMLAHAEEWAVSEAGKRVQRLTKQGMLRCFGKVVTVLTTFFDLKPPMIA